MWAKIFLATSALIDFKGPSSMPVESNEAQTAIREAADDYFHRSDAIGRLRQICSLPSDNLAAQQHLHWSKLVELGWPGLSTLR